MYVCTWQVCTGVLTIPGLWLEFFEQGGSAGTVSFIHGGGAEMTLIRAL